MQETPRPPRRIGRAVLLALFGLSVYLAAESFQPPRRQPSARLCLAALDGYRATLSAPLHSAGFRCRYEPSCSRYASDAVALHGTAGGLALALGRLWRCSPWGGSGTDPVAQSD